LSSTSLNLLHSLNDLQADIATESNFTKSKNKSNRNGNYVNWPIQDKLNKPTGIIMGEDNTL